MAGLLLLTTLATLTTFGSCHLVDPGNSPTHNLTRRQSIVCASALSSWKYNDFKTCYGDTILIDGGNGSIDLSSWTNDELINIFSKKTFVGGFTIKGSSIAGVGVMFETRLSNDNYLIIKDNPNLVDFFLDVISNTTPPHVHISGNRQLTERTLYFLDELFKTKQIHAGSHIQAYQECDLDGKPVVDVAATLENCKAIYGDLVFDASSKFPVDKAGLKSIEKLAYVQGCLRITGTQFKSWKDLTFLDGTKTKEGGCTAGHEISGNSQMCIHPPEALKLEAMFRDMTIANNQACTPECTSRHVLDKADSLCEIITDSLIIDNKATNTSLGALQNVKEIKGLLRVTNSSIEDFNYLPKLTKLNSNNISAAPVITLQRNPQMTSFDLPLLQTSGVGMGRDEQIKLWTDKNGPDGTFKGDAAFVKRIDAEDSQVAITPAPIVTTTTEKVAIKAKEIDTIDVIQHNWNYILIRGVAPAGVFVALVIIVVIPFACGCLAIRGEWKTAPPTVEAEEQTDIYQYHKKNKFNQMARDIIEENKPKIEAVNQRHRDNRDYKQLSILNHNATCKMPGIFQWKDYEQNKTWIHSRGKKISTLTLPAQIKGHYGLEFDDAINGKYPADLKYRTQCDLSSVNWFKANLAPIYVENFESTARRMCHMPCDAISENLRYLRSKSIEIPEYGITTRGFQMETGLFGKVHGPRKAEEREDLIWIKDQIPSFKFYRYREKMNELGTNVYPKKLYMDGRKNLHQFVIRMMETMMSMPVGHVLNLKGLDVIHFLRVVHPDACSNKARELMLKHPGSPMSAGGYSVDMNRTHVRLVGELRGDFDALRRAINIPSLLDGKDHPMLQYNWLFLGNYTGRHPQSVETIMFLLALQFLYGRDCIVLLRGVMEFSNTSEEYGFKKHLKKRFGRIGNRVWEDFMKVFARLPLNCRVLHAVYCCSGGFNDGDIAGKDEDIKRGQYKKKTTLQSLNKIFSLPNYTVRDYFENVDTGAGYYYGERVLQKIAEDTDMCTFFTTGPMTGGVGYFCDTTPVNMFMLSSVKGLHGHGGMVTQLAAVAELNGKTGRVTFHMMLEEDQMVYYDPLQRELRDTPFEEEEDGKKTTTTTETGTPTGELATPVGTKTVSSEV